MNTIPQSLKSLGFDDWFLKKAEETSSEFDVARVVAVHKESYGITSGEGDIQAELVGKIRFTATSPLEYPAVGDWVVTSTYDDNTFAIIHELLARKTVLKRKTPGKKVDFQLIAANIDVALIVQSLNENFNISRLERYLVMVLESKIEPVVLLSKSDLMANSEIASAVAQVKAIMPDIVVIPFSNTIENGAAEVIALLQPGLTYCLLGSSGVGKTSLINTLVGEPLYATREVSKKESKGRHATTHRELIQLGSGALLVDTPGMRELGIMSSEAGIDETFSDITTLTGQCRFNDCTHISEKGCAVLAAVELGELSFKRYQNYLKMVRESNFNEMSYVEKRTKDKQFTKHCKRVMKQKRKKQR